MTTTTTTDGAAEAGKRGPNRESLRARVRRYFEQHPYDLLTMSDAERVFGATKSQLQFVFSELKREGRLARESCWGAPKAFELGS